MNIKNLTERQKALIGSIVLLVFLLSYIVLRYKFKSSIVIKGDTNNDIESVQTENITQEASQDEETKETQQIEVEKEPKKIVVYVCGQVKTPSVVELPEGSRMNDAVKNSGGALKDADLNNINLARRIVDGERIYIPKTGEVVKSYSSSESSSSGNLISINSSSLSQLEGIPGVGPSTASKIIDYREKNGPFKRINDLKKVSGIGDKKFDSIKKYITI